MSDNNEKFENMYEKVLDALKKAHKIEDISDEKSGDIRDFFKRKKLPHSFRMYEEIAKALQSDTKFYLKFLKIVYDINISDLKVLVDIAYAEDDLSAYIPPSEDFYRTDEHLFKIVSLDNKQRSAIIVPGGIAGIDAEYEIADSVMRNEKEAIDLALGRVYGFYTAGSNEDFSYGKVVVTNNSSYKSVDEIIDNLIKNKAQWKKKKIKVNSVVNGDLIDKDFQDKDFIVDKIDTIALTDGENSVAVVPPEKISEHFFKVLNIYFNSNHAKQSVKVTKNIIDISKMTLSSRKRKKKFTDKVAEVEAPYKKILKIDDLPGAFEVVSDRDTNAPLSEILFKVVTKKEKSSDLSKVWLVNNFYHFQVISTDRSVIYKLPKSIVKIDKCAYPVFDTKDEKYSPTPLETLRSLNDAVYDTFGVRLEFNSNVLYADQKDGRLYKLENADYLKQKEVKLNVKISNEKTKPTIMKMRKKVGQVDNNQLNDLFLESLKEKARQQMKKTS